MKIELVVASVRGRRIPVVVERRRRYAHIRIDLWNACLELGYDLDAVLCKLIDIARTCSNGDVSRVVATVTRYVLDLDNVSVDSVGCIVAEMIRLVREIARSDSTCRW